MHSFVQETGRERPFGRPRHRMVESIKTDLHETGWQTWIGLIWHRTGSCKHGETLGLINCGEFVG
jgi:hypothetical protein